MICAIHQPNFFPWMGYFNKIARSDVFVFLNQVDYEKSGNSMQCYTNRVSILNGIKSTYIHCPVIREHGPQPICNVKINNTLQWRQELEKVLDVCYKKAPYYEELKNYITELIFTEADNIADYNIKIIRNLVHVFQIETKIVRQDELNTSKHSTDLLVEIAKAVECDTYMCGKGGDKYQNEETFNQYKIQLLRQNYKPIEYNQGNVDFVAGLSILDALFWNGIEKTRELIKGNRI